MPKKGFEYVITTYYDEDLDSMCSLEKLCFKCGREIEFSTSFESGKTKELTGFTVILTDLVDEYSFDEMLMILSNDINLFQIDLNNNVNEEYIIKNADSFDWNFFSYDKSIHSDYFFNRVREKIKIKSNEQDVFYIKSLGNIASNYLVSYNIHGLNVKKESIKFITR